MFLLSIFLFSLAEVGPLPVSSYSDGATGVIYGNMLFDGKQLGKGWLELVREDTKERVGTLAMQNGSYVFDGLSFGSYHVEMSLYSNPRNMMRLTSKSISITAESPVCQVPIVDTCYWGLVSPLDDEWVDLLHLNSSNPMLLSAAPFPNASKYTFFMKPVNDDSNIWIVDSTKNEVAFDGNISNGQGITEGDYIWNVQITTDMGWIIDPSKDSGALIHFFEPSDMGNLSISTTPQGASIIIDGCMRNEISNTTVQFLSPGNHTVVLFKDALVQRETVQIERGNTLFLDCVLSSATTGMIIGKTTYNGTPVSMKMTMKKHESTYGSFVHSKPDGTYIFDELPFGEYDVGSWPGAVDISFSRKSSIHLDSLQPIANLSAIDVYFSLEHPLEWEKVNSTLVGIENPLTFQWSTRMTNLKYSVCIASMYGDHTWSSDWISANSTVFSGTFSDSTKLSHTFCRFTIYGNDDDPGGWWGQSTTYDLNIDGLSELVQYKGSFNEIIAPEWYRQEIEKYDMMMVLDRGYLLEGQMAGTNPHVGKKQSYVYDYTQSFAAGSGNPIMMGKWGWRPDDPAEMLYCGFHELGHGFQTGSCQSFDKLIAGLGGSVSGSFAEAFASLSCFYVTDAIQNEAGHYGLGEDATSKLVQRLQRDKQGNLDALAMWKNETAPFSNLTSVEVVCGIFYELAETHGWAWPRQFFKIFLPANQQWSTVDEADDFDKRITLIALCLSAAAGTDLRDQFKACRAPLDDDFFFANNASIYERMNRMGTPSPTGLSVSLKNGEAHLSWNLSTSLYGTAGYNVYRNISTSQNPVKINLFIATGTEFIDNETNSVEPPSEGSSYVYFVTSVNNALEPSESNGSDPVTLTISNIPPNIAVVTQAPLENVVLPSDSVKINATVTDDVSGVRCVTLIYTFTGSVENWTISMTNIEESIWNATLPAFPLGTNVTYAIIAEDNCGNTVTTEEMGLQFQYSVIPEFSLILVLPLIVATTLLASISYRRNRRFR